MSRPITLYYAATILFFVLDYVLGINVRVAFLEPYPAARLAYYAICFVLFALTLWRPNWALLIGTVESLAVVVALTFSMALRVMIITPDMIDTGIGWVTLEEVLNYVMVGGIAYWSWYRGSKLLKDSKISKRPV